MVSYVRATTTPLLNGSYTTPTLVANSGTRKSAYRGSFCDDGVCSSNSGDDCSVDNDCEVEKSVGKCIGCGNRDRCFCQVPPLICKEVPVKYCSAYIAFANILVFMVNIPSIPDSHRADKCKGLLNLAKSASTYEDYDSLVQQFYFNDVINGVAALCFDINFMLYFLNRFQYYLSIVYCSNQASIVGGNVLTLRAGGPVNLLCIPPRFANATYGSINETARIFNTIITDTTITGFLTKFCQILLFQIKEALNPNFPNKNVECLKLDTYILYSGILSQLIQKIVAISNANLQQKINFSNSNVYQVVFLTQQLVPDAALATPTAFNVIEVDITLINKFIRDMLLQ